MTRGRPTGRRVAWRVTAGGLELGVVRAADRHEATARGARRYGVPAAAVRVREVRPPGWGCHD